MKDIVLVGAQSFWDCRTHVEQMWPETIEVRFNDHFELSADCRQRTVALIVADHPIGPTEMDRFPALRVISRTGTGYDNVDVAAARARGVVVARAAQLNAEAVSEFALGCIFEFAKDFRALHETMMAGQWQKRNALRISDLTIGIVGLGTIGRSLVEKLHHLGVHRILGHNRSLRPEILRLCETSRLELVNLSAVLSESDMIILSIALTPETVKLIGLRELMLVKPTACLINICRGAVVDEEALARQVAAGQIGGVALDVYSLEPPMADLHQAPFMLSLKASAAAGRRVLLSPHTAWRTEGSLVRISQQVVRNVLGVLNRDLTGVEVVS